ncbi:hypothetical protein CHS0354_041986 [Potamilus streckersoni]|uniref:Uncharacterized protein n=1 Tax=Potamilus streckersoni TaxID=2493646 RepID=A0AAE0T9P2_9BIVA|nr:hypothetical protein CHS0354_041986 [Potamilus streckersoni]
MTEIQSLTNLAAETVSQSIGFYNDEVCTELPREIWEHLMWHLCPEALHRLTNIFKKKGIGCNKVWKKHVKGPFRTRYEKSCKSEYGVLHVGHVRSPRYHEAYIIRKVSEILFEQKNQGERSEELKTSNKTTCILSLHKKLMPYSSFLTNLELNSTYCKVLVSDKDTAKFLVRNVLSLKIDFVYQKYYQDVVNLVKLLRCEGNLRCASFHEMRVDSFIDLLLMCSTEYSDSDDSHNFQAGFRQKRKCHISGQSNIKKICCGIVTDVNASCNSVMKKPCAVCSIDDEKFDSEHCNTFEQFDGQLLGGKFSDSLEKKQHETTGLYHFDEAIFAEGDENSHESSKDRHFEQTSLDLFDDDFVSKFDENSNQSVREKQDEQISFSYSDESFISEADENSDQIVKMENAETADFDLFDEAVISGDNAVANQSNVSLENMQVNRVKLCTDDHVLEPNCSRRFNACHDKCNKVDNPLPSYIQTGKLASRCRTGSPCCFQENTDKIDVESQNAMDFEDHSTNAKHLSNIESLHMNFAFTGTATQPTPVYNSLATLMEILPKWKSLQRLGLEFFGHSNYGPVDLSPVIKLIQKKQLTHAMINTNAMEETFIANIIHTLLLEYGESQGHSQPMGMLKLEDHSGKQINLPALSGCDGKIQGVSWLILQDMGFQDLSGLHQLIEADVALRHLNLTGCHLRGGDLEKIFKSLSSTCVIEELIIDYNHLESIDIDAQLIKFLQKVKHLKKLHMKYCWIQKELVENPEFIKAIQHHSCLEELALPLNFLGSAATDFLINIFTDGAFPKLQRLDISDNRIEGKHLFSAAARLKQAIELNPAMDRYLLERLDVSCSLLMVQEIDLLHKEFKDIVSDFVVTSKSSSNADFIAQM